MSQMVFVEIDGYVFNLYDVKAIDIKKNWIKLKWGNNIKINSEQLELLKNVIIKAEGMGWLIL